jgi:hypothetical protein
LPAWADADGDCQNTRTEVLVAEADGPLTMSASGCTVTAGVWNDPYTGRAFADPADLDIDHLVPLAEAHRSGGWRWSTEVKRAYANDLAHDETLLAVDDGANASKSDQTPDRWLPPSPAYWCTYAIDWVGVKTVWNLTVTTAERAALVQILTSCS